MRTHAYLTHIITNFQKIILDYFCKKTPYYNFFAIFPVKNTVFDEKALVLTAHVQKKETQKYGILSLEKRCDCADTSFL